MVDKHDLRRLALALDGVEERDVNSFTFRRDGRIMVWPYPERIHLKKARVPRYDQFVPRWRMPTTGQPTCWANQTSSRPTTTTATPP